MFNRLSSLSQKIQVLLSEAPDLSLIRSSGLFDKDWYVAKYPEVAKATISPIRHYLRHGGFEGRDPSPKFYSRAYLDIYMDVSNAGINPLIHYLKYGKKEGRIPRPSFKRGENNLPGAEMIQCDPIIVHQMGKVGSRTVVTSLEKTFEELGLAVSIFHTHALNDFETVRQRAIEQRNRLDPKSTLEVLDFGERVRNLIDANPAQHCNVITLVRDPVARNVAAFFHDLAKFIPDWQERHAAGQLTAYDVQEVFLLKFPPPFKHLDRWFDIQIKDIPAFGIDVYATPFPHDLGYKIYPGSAQASLLLIRLKDLTTCAKRAIQEFLGLENFSLHNANVGGEKEYADLYQAFKQLPLPLDYVKEAYNTRFAQHFYSKAELDKLTTKWTKETKNSPN